MRKIHLLMPTILVTSSMPMVSMVGCNNEKPEPAPQNLTFTALGEGFEINLFNDCYEIEEALIPELYYSIDNGKPIKYQIPPNDEGPTITIRKGSSISF
ncbi:MAG: hypothetical protein MJ219_00555 [Mycoplasmoidaceae bacterium]|nr:hypothetical protein [Mycoplasmoidaceae bacterium]